MLVAVLAGRGGKAEPAITALLGVSWATTGFVGVLEGTEMFKPADTHFSGALLADPCPLVEEARVVFLLVVTAGVLT